MTAPAPGAIAVSVATARGTALADAGVVDTFAQALQSVRNAAPAATDAVGGLAPASVGGPIVLTEPNLVEPAPLIAPPIGSAVVEAPVSSPVRLARAVKDQGPIASGHDSVSAVGSETSVPSVPQVSEPVAPPPVVSTSGDPGLVASTTLASGPVLTNLDSTTQVGLKAGGPAPIVPLGAGSLPVGRSPPRSAPVEATPVPTAIVAFPPDQSSAGVTGQPPPVDAAEQSIGPSTGGNSMSVAGNPGPASPSGKAAVTAAPTVSDQVGSAASLSGADTPGGQAASPVPSTAAPANAKVAPSTPIAQVTAASLTLVAIPAASVSETTPPLPSPPTASGRAGSTPQAPDRKAGGRTSELAASLAAPLTGADMPVDQAASPVPFTATPTNAVIGATTAAPTDAAPAPAAQLAPALLTLAKTADGNQQMTVRLHPADLGMVQVRIETASTGITRVEITAEKADTIQALLRDQPQLHRTLDDAGIPVAGRTITFHVAQPLPAQVASSSNTPAHGGGHAAAGGRSGSGTAETGLSDGNGSPGGGKTGYTARETNPWSRGRRQGNASAAANANTSTTTRLYRAGLDITA